MDRFDGNPDSVASKKAAEYWEQLNARMEVWRKTIETALGRELTSKETLEGFE